MMAGTTFKNNAFSTSQEAEQVSRNSESEVSFISRDLCCKVGVMREFREHCLPLL